MTGETPPLVPDQVVELSPLLRRVLCANPGMMTGPGTNTYVVGREDLAVIDPGPDQIEHIEAVAGVGVDPQAPGGNRIRWIICTHTHPDHSPGAPRLAEMTGAEILAFADRDGLECTRHLADGDRIIGADFTLQAIHTPGHASNHVCLLLEEERLLLTGDHVMDGSTVVITPPDGDMARYLESLRRLSVWEPPMATIAPAHGRLIDDPAAKIAEYLAHRLQREQQVAEALAAVGSDGADTAVLVAAIYTDVPEFLHPIARYSVWAHLRKLADEGRASAQDRDDPDAVWAVA